MKSGQTAGRNRKRHIERRDYMQICPTYKIRRLTDRELDQFRKGVQAVIDRGPKA